MAIHVEYSLMVIHIKTKKRINGGGLCLRRILSWSWYY